MNIKLENFFLFFMVVADFTRTVSSFDSKCSALKVVNGRSKYRWKGRSVRFSCMRGFQLVGVKYAICMNGKWDADVPICVKYGCRVPSTTHVNGQFIESYRGAVVKIVCNPGYTLVGSPSVYCNGAHWNETFPVCRAKDSDPALFCGFEDPNLCGWSQDPMHFFDWKRRNGSTPSEDVGTNHTRGENSTGYYMHLEGPSLRVENDASRLYSPVYPAEYSNGTCFRFWYLLYGAATGFLKVYVKPEGVDLSTLIPSFWVNGEQGKFWIESFFPIEPMETPFQIVIEGERGAEGDTAFDDVKLTSADECKILEEMTTSTEYTYSTTPDEYTAEFMSCKNRCSKDQSNGTGMEDDKCSCSDSCFGDGNCCPDYVEFCYSVPLESTTQTDLETSTSTSSSPAVPTQSSYVYPSTTPTEQPERELPSSPSKPSQPQHFNNESNEIFPVPVQPNNKQKPETAPQSEIPIVRNATPAKKKFPKPGMNKTKAAMLPVNETKEIPRRQTQAKAVGKAPGKIEITNSTAVTPTSYTTTFRAVKNSKPNNIKLTFLEKPSSPNLSNESRFTKGNTKEVSGKAPPQAIKIDKSEGIVEMGLAAVAILAIIILGVVFYKRREHRKTERENMVEDSDSIVYEMDSSTMGSESHSLVCIRPGGLQQSI